MDNTIKSIALCMVISSACFATELRSLYVTDPVSGVQANVNSEGQLHVVQTSKADTNNSTQVALGANAAFIGTSTDLSSGYSAISTVVQTDAPGATKGFNIEYSQDGVEWHIGESYTIPANSTKFYTPPTWLKYYRLCYTNGAVANTNFHIHTQIHKNTMKWSSHNVNDEIKDEDDAELGISVIHARNPDGVYGSVGRSTSGNLLIHDAENPTAIAFGEVVGKSIIQKFGNAPDFDTSDGAVTIWDGAADGEIFEAMQYPYSTTADIAWISAENAGDTQLIEIQGLGATSNLVVQTATLNGQNLVALSTNLYRVFRIKNRGTTDFADHVFVHTNGTLVGGVPSGSDVRAVVDDGNNQTEMSIFTVPGDKEAVIKGLYFYSAGAKKTAVYLCSLWARSPGEVFRLQWKGSFDDSIDSGIRQPYETGLYYDSGTDIELRVEIITVGVTDATISAGFEIELKDK